MKHRAMTHRTRIAAALFALTGIIIVSGFIIYSSPSSQEQTVLPASAFMQALSATPDAVLVDVRTPTEYQSGHLKGAINLDEEDAGFSAAVSHLDMSKTYFLYCRSGHRSALAAATMRAAGFAHLYELQGGVTAAPELISR